MPQGENRNFGVIEGAARDCVQRDPAACRLWPGASFTFKYECQAEDPWLGAKRYQSFGSNPTPPWVLSLTFVAVKDAPGHKRQAAGSSGRSPYRPAFDHAKFPVFALKQGIFLGLQPQAIAPIRKVEDISML